MLIPGLNFTNVADVTTTTPGSVVRYTVTASNTGQTDLRRHRRSPSTWTALLDDATYNYDATTSTGSLQPQRRRDGRWVLDLAPGDSATGTLSFTVHDPDLGRPCRCATSSAPMPPGSELPDRRGRRRPARRSSRCWCRA